MARTYRGQIINLTKQIDYLLAKPGIYKNQELIINFLENKVERLYLNQNKLGIL